jgi:hypothetical protein
MSKRAVLGFILGLALLCLPAAGQETAVKGNLSGTVFDAQGLVVASAKVTMTGAIGSKTVESNDQGTFTFPLLVPGMYSVKVEKTGFRSADVKDVEVFAGKTSAIRVKLEVGATTETVVVAASAVAVDTSSTAVGANLSDAFYESVPVPRNVTGLFQLSAGVVSGGGTGTANPSISGSSGLENLYVADGVNITESGFGGMGVFSRIYGSLGTGINLSFIQEVQVKTAGFEPQYGHATGGIVQIVTKSGSNSYHGALFGYMAPQSFEATRLQADDFGRLNLGGKLLHQGNFDGGGEFGGYVPGLKDKLFFFGSFDPSLAQNSDLAPKNSNLFSHGAYDLRTATYNYAGKLTYKINNNHTIESSGFGDPSHRSFGPWNTLSADNNTGFSRMDFGTANWVFRYNGALSPTWLINASITYSNNRYEETGFANLYAITNNTQVAGLPGQRGSYLSEGHGTYENYTSNNYAFNVDTQKTVKFAGQHTFSIGYRFERPYYDDNAQRSGPSFAIPGTNATGQSVTTMGVPASFIGQNTNATLRLSIAAASCTLCPLMTVPGFSAPQPVYLLQTRGGIAGFGNAPVSTQGTNHGAYVNDSWNMNRYVTVNAGVRWEEQLMNGVDLHYAFTGNWLPHFGISYDPWGNRKSKIYANYARYDYTIPLDLAIRSLSNEIDFEGGRFAPAFTTNAAGQRIVSLDQYGSVIPALDSAHLLTKATGGTGSAFTVSSQGNLEAFAAGTKAQAIDEFVVGYEREFKNGMVLSARYLDRRFRRIVEDTGGISPEAALAGVNQVYVIANPGPSTDLFTNPIGHQFTSGGTPPKACDPNLVADPVQDTFGNTLGAICFETNGKNGQAAGSANPDGVPDGFPQALRKYQAVEFELNKGFGHNWQLRTNYRIARLTGNYEGAFRNDNGQTDPSISSLFDFTAGVFGLLGDQFKPGVLNTDRLMVVNSDISYVLPKTRLKGLVLGSGFRLDTGTPINDLKAHPVYLNAGEIPVNGRGSLGRLPTTGEVDLHVEYPWKISEKKSLHLGMDMFNIADARRITGINQNEDLSFGVPNTDFKSITSFQRPFYARAMFKFVF